MRAFDNATISGAIVLLVISAQSIAAPVVDGRLDPSEGYSSGNWVSFTVERSDIIVTDGQLWTYEDAATGDVSVYFRQPLTLVDNTYGDNAIGWGKNTAPSGKNHNFKDLKGSDKAEMSFTNAHGETVLEITMDYISETFKGSGVYGCLGVIGGDGSVDFGPAAGVQAVGSSLAYNFNVLNHVLTEDSPLTDANYTENPAYPGWIFEVGYELRIAGETFGASGFGDVCVPVVHDSPNKIGKNKVFPEVGSPVPEPATMVLLAFALPTLLKRRRRQARMRA